MADGIIGTGLKVIGGLVVVGAVVRGIGDSRKKKLAKKPTSSSSSPFLDKECKVLGDEERVNAWFKKHAEPRISEAIMVNPLTQSDPPDVQMARVSEYVGAGLSALPGQCTPIKDEPARMALYKAIWCNITIALSAQGFIDEEMGELMQACMNDQWHPLDPVDGW